MANKKILRAFFPGGYVIQEGKPTETFISALRKIGLEKVNESGYPAVKSRGILLVKKKKETSYDTLVDGWYIYPHWDVPAMARILNKLSLMLGCGVEAVVIESQEEGSEKSIPRRILLEMEGDSYAEKFRKTIIAIGPDRVRALGIIRSGRNIVYSPAPGQRPEDGQVMLRNGLFLNTKFSNNAKDAILEEIASSLGIVIRIIKLK